MSSIFQILIVDETDTSLAPLFVGMLKKRFESEPTLSNFELVSAGAFAGREPRQVERRVLEKAWDHGIRLERHRSRTVTIKDLEASSLVLAMNGEVYWYIKGLGPDPALTIRQVGEFSKMEGLGKIPDPLMGETGVQDSFELLSKCENGLCEYLLAL